MFIAKARKCLEHRSHLLGFARSNAYRPRDTEFLVGQFGLGLLHEGHDFLSALTQAHAVPREHA